LARPGPLALVLLLGNVGVSTIGTLVSAATCRLRQSGNLLALLVLPLLTPVLLGAAECTRLLTHDRPGPEWWRWVQLLVAFDVIFVTAGVVLCDFVLED
jgi:heme exporter protein B